MTQPVTPDLTNAGMDVTELAVGAKDVIASTAERFTSVIEGLLQHLSLENVLMQIAAVFVSMAIGYVISRRINTLVDRVLPGEDVRGLGAYAAARSSPSRTTFPSASSRALFSPSSSTASSRSSNLRRSRWSSPESATTSSTPLRFSRSSWPSFREASGCA